MEVLEAQEEEEEPQEEVLTGWSLQVEEDLEPQTVTLTVTQSETVSVTA